MAVKIEELQAVLSCNLEDILRELLGDLSRGGGGEDQSLLCELLMGSDTREQCLAAAAGDVKFFSKFPNHFITRHNIESRAAAAAASSHHTHAGSGH